MVAPDKVDVNDDDVECDILVEAVVAKDFVSPVKDRVVEWVAVVDTV